MKGKININITFPIISFIDEIFSLSQSIEAYAICKKSHISVLNKLEETVIDAEGCLYKRGLVKPLQYINIFKGFSLKFAGFGVCYLSIELSKEKMLSADELKLYGMKILNANKEFYEGTLLPIKRWKTEFEQLADREDVLRYMFYFTGTSYYYNPDKKDTLWRQRRGFTYSK